jgi:protein N-terminal methyltransferase
MLRSCSPFPLVDPADSTSADVSEKKHAWYQKGADYWLSQAASVDGVLGGFGHISPVDLSGSKTWLQKLPGVRYQRAIDCGAGIGRISKGLLCPLFKEVDLVEQNPVYVAKAREYCAGEKTMRTYYTEGLQTFSFASGPYDVIWIQWVIGHLPDADFLPFMQRCSRGLREGGYIVVKENNAKKGFVMDLDDQSVTRTDAQYRELFEQADLDLVSVELQKNFPASLFPVRMYALKPRKTQQAAPAAAADQGATVAASATAMDTAQ